MYDDDDDEEELDEEVVVEDADADVDEVDVQFMWSGELTGGRESSDCCMAVAVVAVRVLSSFLINLSRLFRSV